MDKKGAAQNVLVRNDPGKYRVEWGRKIAGENNRELRRKKKKSTRDHRKGKKKKGWKVLINFIFSSQTAWRAWKTRAADFNIHCIAGYNYLYKISLRQHNLLHAGFLPSLVRGAGEKRSTNANRRDAIIPQAGGSARHSGSRNNMQSEPPPESGNGEDNNGCL